jgi:catechol 2,3-dioxygenase-like lactoylglutathione lyase family enzyme
MLASRLVAAEKFALGGGWRTVVRGRRADVSPVFLTTDRILELAHPLPERTPHLREALRAEHEQRDDQDDDHPCDTDLGHTVRLDDRPRGRRNANRVPVITGVHHFALTVSDVDRAVAFYGDFGLEVVADREVAGDYVEQITGVPGAKVRICHLSGHGHNLELLQYLAPPGAPRARRLQDVGSAHLCFLTDDLDAQCEWLRERGIRFRSPGPVTTTSGPNTGGKGIYIEDPDGNAAEIVQLARPWSSAE